MKNTEKSPQSKLVTIEVVLTEDLTQSQNQDIERLGKVCFGKVDQKEAKEHFYAKGFAWVFALHGDEIVGLLELHKRNRVFDNIQFLLGGIGGVCVIPEFRKKGIGKRLMLMALDILKREKCDVVCLNVDLEEPMYGFYEKLGFEMMERKISFTDINGDLIFDTGTMFKPLNSKKVFNHIMNSDKTFHYGEGYW